MRVPSPSNILTSLAFILIASVPARALAQPEVSAQERQRVARLASRWAADLARHCPVAAPGDQAAFDACRARVFKNAELERALPPYLLWGRQAVPRAALRDTNLTQFAPDVWLGIYLPLFMFNGKHTIEYVASEGLFRIRLEAAFRSRLAPGQFPYPFWHNKDKWGSYQGAKSLLLWVDPRSAQIRVAQYTPLSPTRPLVASGPTERKFGGKWMWTDASGKLQPQVTLFDGLYSPGNPYKARLEVAYRDLALQMRAGQCSTCHVPSNPFGMKRLVLLQTPAHAAGEIKRVLLSVRDNRMPLDELGVEQPLDPTIRKALLESGARFDAIVDAANRWEARHRPGGGDGATGPGAAPSRGARVDAARAR